MTKEEKLESLFQYEDSSGNCSCNKYDVEKFIKQSLQEQEEERIELLEKYTRFLLKNGYVDDDVWCEEPTAIERFLNKRR